MAGRRRRGWGGPSWGFSLVEVVLTVAVASTLTVALLGAVSVTARVVTQLDGDVVAQELARTQMEYVKGYTPYLTPPATYPTVSPPTGYAVSAIAESVPDRGPEVSRVVVTVTRGGKALVTVEGYKSDR